MASIEYVRIKYTTMRHFFALLVLLDPWIAYSQSTPSIIWQDAMGGSSYDTGSDIKATADGGYIMVGSSTSTDGDVTGQHGNTDVWVTKLDPQGAVIWEHAFGGTDQDNANAVFVTDDNGCILVGFTKSEDGDVQGSLGSGDIWVLKLDESGSIDWQTTLGGENLDEGFDIIQTSDGGYALTGRTNSTVVVNGNHGSYDMWLVKLNSIGNFMWQKCFGGLNEEYGTSLIQTTDGGFVIAGQSNSNTGDVSGAHGLIDYWVVKVNSTGTLQWQKTLGGSSDDIAESLIQSDDEGYIVVGRTSSNNGNVTGNHGQSDVWAVKLDADGNMVWQHCYGGSGWECGYDILDASDGNYVITGTAAANGGDVTGNHGYPDVWTLKIDSNGQLLWQLSSGGTAAEEAHAICQDAQNNLTFCGYTDSNNGDVTGQHGNGDVWLVKLGPDVVGISEIPKSVLEIAPNPSNEQVSLHIPFDTEGRLQIFNAGGNCLFDRTVVTQDTWFSLSVAHYPTGLYQVVLSSAVASMSRTLNIVH